MTTLWSFLLVLSGLILVHEFGHFLMARSLGITVLKLSLGFGPRVWGVIRGATDYCISAFPLGGFVKMLGEQPNEPIPDEDIPGSFSHRPVWQRAAVVVSGPLSNLVFAWVVFFVIFLGYGNPVLLPDIGEVQPGSAAADAGILPDDRIVAIDGTEVFTWDEVSEKIRASEGKTLDMTLQRAEHMVSVTVTPQINTLKNIFGEEVNVPVIGVTAAGHLKVERLNPTEAVSHALFRTWELIVLTGQGFLKIVQRVVPLSTLGGPIMIAQLAGQQAEQGILNLFYFMALLSINLGLLNLLPIPVLDGGHLVFYGIEAVLGRPLTPRQMAVAQRVGLLILGVLMLFVFYNDIVRLLGVSSATGMP
jgi:regulator of sigma E protease